MSSLEIDALAASTGAVNNASSERLVEVASETDLESCLLWFLVVGLKGVTVLGVGSWL